MVPSPIRLRIISNRLRERWSSSSGKEESGYHIRSLEETTLFRLKTIFNDKLSARLLEIQTTQASIRCLVLNKMTHLGYPVAYIVPLNLLNFLYPV
jgi:hypothetical protein